MRKDKKQIIGEETVQLTDEEVMNLAVREATAVGSGEGAT